MDEYREKLRTLINDAKQNLSSSEFEEWCNEALDLFEEEIGIPRYDYEDFDDDF